MLILLLSSLLLLLLPLVSADKHISFLDKNIHYYGHWHTTQNSIQSNWPGAYFKVTLKNTRHIQLQLNTPTSLFIQLNNQSHITLTNITTSLIDLNSYGLQLQENNNQLLVISIDVHSPNIGLQSIVVDASSTTVPESTDPIIEFIGHDLTIGIHTSQSLFTSYAWLTSQLLGTEPQIIAYKEATLIAGIEKSYFDWSPSTHQKAWGIVVLLGSNDFQHTEEEYRISCTAFLSNVRKTLRPEDPIFVLSEPLGDMFRPSQQSVIDLSAIDSSLYFIDTTAWIRYGSTYYRDYGHLTDMGHSLLAKKLAPLLQLKLNYPRQPLPGPAPNPNLPGDWQTMDIGEDNRIGLPGTVSADSGSTFTLWGSGADIDNEKDAFRFVYQPFSNQGVIESTVRSHSAFAKCAKAGIMIREHFGHGSPLIMLGISPADGVFIQVRYHNFGPTKLIKKMRASPPYRLRLIRLRESGLFEAQIQQIDSNGNTNTWETFSRIPFILARDVYAGLAVTSCDVSVVSVAKFTEVNLQHSSFGGLNTPRLIEQYS